MDKEILKKNETYMKKSLESIGFLPVDSSTYIRSKTGYNETVAWSIEDNVFIHSKGEKNTVEIPFDEVIVTANPCSPMNDLKIIRRKGK